MNNNLLFYTCATGFYKDFVIPFIFFASSSNRGSSFEILVDNLESFNEKHRKSLDYFMGNGIEVVIREIPNLEYKPKMDNSYRFITEPELTKEYVYIGDIDIMIVEDILTIHSKVFDKGYAYSNIKRKNLNRLSGLHLCKHADQYPLPDISDLIKSIHNDEELLYRIMDRKDMIYSEEEYASINRPQHGIHMSKNRLPFSYTHSRVDWGITYEYAMKSNNYFEQESFKQIYSSLHVSSRQVINNIILLCRGVLSFDHKEFTSIIGSYETPVDFK